MRRIDRAGLPRQHLQGLGREPGERCSPVSRTGVAKMSSPEGERNKTRLQEIHKRLADYYQCKPGAEAVFKDHALADLQYALDEVERLTEDNAKLQEAYDSYRTYVENMDEVR